MEPEGGRDHLCRGVRRAGYRTFFAGKWHLGDTGADLEDFGFEINKGGWKMGSPMGGYFAPWDNPKLEPGSDGESLPLRLGRETVRFIGDHRDQPFLRAGREHDRLLYVRQRWRRHRRRFLRLDAAAARRQGTPVGGRHSRTPLCPRSGRGGGRDHVRRAGFGHRLLPHAPGSGGAGDTGRAGDRRPQHGPAAAAAGTIRPSLNATCSGTTPTTATREAIPRR